jgi:acetylornithine deacetylase/succinyl-diaminopimelate desuccinylase-like protein
MKGMGIIELMTFVLLKRQGVELKRSLTFLAAADEEAGSAYGVAWLAEHRPHWLESDLVINEGAYGLTGIGGKDTPLFQFAPSEKIPFWLELTVKGRPGHGSVPHGDNCAEHLVQALEKVTRWKQPLRMTPLMRAHFEAMHDAGLSKARNDSEAIALAERNPAVRARLSNTVSLTTIDTGIKVNVIPAIATATLDCRLLPDVDPAGFLAELKQIVDDERVSFRILNEFEGAESPLAHQFAEVVRRVVAEMVEGAQLAPELTSGFTDSRIYRKQGVPAYGFVPCLVHPEELAGVHGHNERLSVENLRLGMQVLYEVVRRLCT